MPTEKEQLDGFLAKYTPEMAAAGKVAIQKMRKRLPGALELVYDNYNALAIGYGPTEKASEALFSIALYPRWVSLFFLTGKGLKDPHKLLKGSGNVVRHIVLRDASTLDDSAVQDLMEQALKLAKVPFDPKAKSRTIIKSVSSKQRPRRPAAK